jgi:chorismate mutase
MILWNTDQHQTEVNHVYLGEAARLRPDIPGKE